MQKQTIRRLVIALLAMSFALPALASPPAASTTWWQTIESWATALLARMIEPHDAPEQPAALAPSQRKGEVPDDGGDDPGLDEHYLQIEPGG